MAEKTTPEDFFLERSKLKIHPKIVDKTLSSSHASSIPPKGRKRKRVQAYKVWIQRRSKSKHEIKLGSKHS